MKKAVYILFGLFLVTGQILAVSPKIEDRLHFQDKEEAIVSDVPDFGGMESRDQDTGHFFRILNLLRPFEVCEFAEPISKKTKPDTLASVKIFSLAYYPVPLIHSP